MVFKQLPGIVFIQIAITIYSIHIWMPDFVWSVASDAMLYDSKMYLDGENYLGSNDRLPLTSYKCSLIFLIYRYIFSRFATSG